RACVLALQGCRWSRPALEFSVEHAAFEGGHCSVAAENHRQHTEESRQHRTAKSTDETPPAERAAIMTQERAQNSHSRGMAHLGQMCRIGALARGRFACHQSFTRALRGCAL